MKISFTSNLNSAAWGVGAGSVHHEKADGVVLFHRCAKTEAVIVETDLCEEELPD